jgi:hypothetical protein
MEEAPENGKESSHSAHANGTNEWHKNSALSTGPLRSRQAQPTQHHWLYQFTDRENKSNFFSTIPKCNSQQYKAIYWQNNSTSVVTVKGKL